MDTHRLVLNRIRDRLQDALDQLKIHSTLIKKEIHNQAVTRAAMELGLMTSVGIEIQQLCMQVSELQRTNTALRNETELLMKLVVLIGLSNTAAREYEKQFAECSLLVESLH